MAFAKVHSVMMEALTAYLRDPWSWPRESDLVVDLVTGIQGELSDARCGAILRGPGRTSRLVDVGASVRRSVPRVRTELKIVPDDVSSKELEADAAHSKEPRGETKQRHLKRADIAVLREREVSLFIHRNGARDVVLHARESDVEVALEVKVYPDLYLKKGDCEWLKDIEKLALLPSKIARGLLLVDTSLPLSNVGITYRTRLRAETSLGRALPHTAAWPLRRNKFTVDRPSGKYRFQPVRSASTDGLYLWAIALRPDTAWAPTFDKTRRIPLLPIGDVLPACWRVHRDTRSPR